MAHEVGCMIIARRGFGWPPTAIMRRERDGKEVPFADSPPPDYITRFRFIQIESVHTVN
jgi:hypothetical protein